MTSESSVASPAGTGLKINLIPDSSVADAPSGFAAAIATAASILEQTITDNITVNIAFGWGTYDNRYNPNLNQSSAEALGGTLQGTTLGYSTVRSLLVTNADTHNDPSIVAALPSSATQFPGDPSVFYVSSAQQKALNDFTGSPTALDGAIGFSTSWTDSTDWVGAALHELTHAMGRVTGYYEVGGTPSILDIYHYSGPGTFDWVGGTQSYFSIDGGTTALADFSTTSDYSDWAVNGLTPTDPFDWEVTSNTLSWVDLKELEAIGFSTTVGNPPQPSSITIQGTTANLAVLDDSTIKPFGGVIITDPNAGQTDTVTVTMSNAANGSFSNVGSGRYNPSTGTYTVIGSAATVSAALDALVFNPTIGEVGPGQTVTTTFRIAVKDTAGAGATDNTTSVVAVASGAGNDRVTLKTAIQASGSSFSDSGEVFVAGGAVQWTGTATVTDTPFSDDWAAYSGTMGEEILAASSPIATDIPDTQFTNTALTSIGAPFSATGLAVWGDPGGNTADSTASDQIAYTFSAALPASTPIMLWAPGGSFNGNTGPFTFTFTASLGGAAVSTSGWSFKVESPFDTSPLATYTPDPATGQVIVTNFRESNFPDAVILVTPNTPIDSLKVTASTIPFDFWGLAFSDIQVAAIGTNGALAEIANQYALEKSGTFEAWVTYGGSVVTAGEFGNWTPIGAVQQATGGYLVAWKQTGASEFIVWTTDSNGNVTGSATAGVVSGTDYTLESLETSFGQDLNSDGTIGPTRTTIATNGGPNLVQIANRYALDNSGGSGPFITLGGSAVTVGELGPWTPIGAVQQASGGYLVAWKQTGASEFIVWTTDSNGNVTGEATAGVVSGADYTLESLETSFGQDLNSDGTIGPTKTTIATDGGTSLVQIANRYALDNSGGSGPFLTFGGSAVTVGELGPWTPIGAVQQASGGYLAVWKETGTSEFIVWTTDSNGNVTGSATAGVVSGTDYTLESLETTFGQDLNGDGTIGLAQTSIATDGGTSLVQVANRYALNNSGGSGPFLTFGGSAVTVGELGPWTPIGAVQQAAGGYLVAWKQTGASEFIVWTTDSNGNVTGSATAGVVSGENFALEDLEPTFGQDLNGDHRLSTLLVTSPRAGSLLNLTGQTQPTTINLGADTASASLGLGAPTLTFIGTPDAITLGSGADTVEYALAPSSGIETIANFVLGADLLNIDLLGAASSVLQAYDTTVGGVHAMTIASSADPAHGLVLLNMTSGQTAANILASHTTFSGGHALIG